MVTLRDLVPPAALLSASIGLFACSPESSPDSQYAIPAASEDRKTTAEKVRPSKAVIAASDNALNDADRTMLEQAKVACKNDDFKSFFQAAIYSKPVRARYFTSSIKTGDGPQSGKNYSFPFEMMDTYFVTADSVNRAREDWENVVLDINQASDNRVRVDWVRIDYGPGGNDPGADDGGAQLADDKEYGPRGYLLFYPTDICWALVEDGIER
jgi:hypothetical protein